MIILFKRLWQKILCSLPFCIFFIGCKRLKIVRTLPLGNSDLIVCQDCGKQYVMNHSLQVVLPWTKDLEGFYRETEAFIKGSPCQH